MAGYDNGAGCSGSDIGIGLNIPVEKQSEIEAGFKEIRKQLMQQTSFINEINGIVSGLSMPSCDEVNVKCSTKPTVVNILHSFYDELEQNNKQMDVIIHDMREQLGDLNLK